MKVGVLSEFLVDWAKEFTDDQAQVVLLTNGSRDTKEKLKRVKQMGYAAMVRTTSFGEEIVVVEKVENGDS